MSVDIYAATSNDGLSAAELDLYDLIMEYRAANGLPSIPLSTSLTTVAGRHAEDTRHNIWEAGLTLPEGANLHSWSDAPYYGDHRQPAIMWEAPQRLGTPYIGNGFEISAAGYSSVEAALEGWKGSPGHNNVILNQDIWTGADWNAIGVGISQPENYDFSVPFGGFVYHVWFGREVDPAGAPERPAQTQPAVQEPDPAPVDSPTDTTASDTTSSDTPGGTGGPDTNTPDTNTPDTSGAGATNAAGGTGSGAPSTAAPQTQLRFAEGETKLYITSQDDLFGATLDGVGYDKSLVFQGQAFGTSHISFDPTSGQLSFDLDRDGTPDGSVTLQGSFGEGAFLASRAGGQTSVTYTKALPSLGDKRAVAADEINGVTNQEFLTGDGSTKFRVSLVEGASAQNKNIVGVYEVDGTGALVNTRLLFQDPGGSGNGSVVLSDVADGNGLGFFILQDGGRALGGLSAQDTFGFEDGSGGSAEISDGNDLHFTVDGARQDVTVLHSYDASLNPGGRTQVLSGADGPSLVLGFEDMVSGSDRDYQDVILQISPFDTEFA